MTNTSRTTAPGELAWALLALVALLLSVPVYAACIAAYTQSSSQHVAMARSLGTPSSHDGCCAKLSVPNSAIAAQSMRQLRMRPPPAAAALVTPYPLLRGTALPSDFAVTSVLPTRRVYALTQRLRL